MNEGRKEEGNEGMKGRKRFCFERKEGQREQNTGRKHIYIYIYIGGT
jgi:hypothetical protein